MIYDPVLATIMAGFLPFVSIVCLFSPLDIARFLACFAHKNRQLYSKKTQRMLQLLEENPAEYERQYKHQLDIFRVMGMLALMMTVFLWYLILT